MARIARPKKAGFKVGQKVSSRYTKTKGKVASLNPFSVEFWTGTGKHRKLSRESFWK